MLFYCSGQNESSRELLLTISQQKTDFSITDIFIVVLKYVDFIYCAKTKKLHWTTYATYSLQSYFTWFPLLVSCQFLFLCPDVSTKLSTK
jgi:hypothetical protein